MASFKLLLQVSSLPITTQQDSEPSSNNPGDNL